MMAASAGPGVVVVALVVVVYLILLIRPAASFRVNVGVGIGGGIGIGNQNQNQNQKPYYDDSNNNNNYDEGEGEGGDDQEGPEAAAPVGPGQSFTGGRGTYKYMAHEFLDAHNKVRAQYGLQPLKWSNKLARYARRWSAARRFDCVMMHSPESPYGENVFWGTGWGWRATDAVKSWAGESSVYDWRGQSCNPGQMCGHFTQIVWNDTQLVGCGRSECVAGGVFITCSYDPPGNWKGEKSCCCCYWRIGRLYIQLDQLLLSGDPYPLSVNDLGISRPSSSKYKRDFLFKLALLLLGRHHMINKS
uniref:SCP domain-containing protein n=1 Tax=Oryza meridionalis TaxID=40149 RepID=A0A0E0DV99_9ORYZ